MAVGDDQTHNLCPDGDIDQSDFGRFQTCLSGADIPADPNCGL